MNLENIEEKQNFLINLKKIIMRYKSIGYYIFVMQKSSCLVVSNFTVLFNRMPVGRGSDSMIAIVWGYNINIMRQFAWL